MKNIISSISHDSSFKMKIAMKQALPRLNPITHKYRGLYIFLILLFAGTGCAFKGLKEDLKEQEGMATLHGKILATSVTSAPIVVAILADNPIHPRLINYRVLTEPGEFIFIVKPDKYRIFAYEDRNRDNRYQPDERVGESKRIEILHPGKGAKIIIHLPDEPDFELARQIKEMKPRVIIELPSARRSLGKIVQLDDPSFSDANAAMGLWQPLRSTREVPLGMFFLEEYDPQKIPVLLVHGVAGSPTHFKEIIARMDRKKFQPWVVFYPSGFRISLIAEYLNLSIRELQTKYGFREMKIVAYSMGGLVSRAFLNSYATYPQHYAIDCFITVSTPWNGHEAANMGLKYAPAVIPVWNDIVPGSIFLDSLFSQNLPEDIPHYLLFGFKGENMFTDGNNDGVVSIASQLRNDAQINATLIRGFNENHTSIIHSETVSTLINEILTY